MLAKSQSGNREAKVSSRSIRGGIFASVKNLRASLSGGGGAGSRAGSVENLVSIGRNFNRSTPLNQEPQSVLVRRRYQLLIVDDSGLNRKLLCKALRAAGHSCDEAADGLLALNKVNTV